MTTFQTKSPKHHEVLGLNVAMLCVVTDVWQIRKKHLVYGSRGGRNEWSSSRTTMENRPVQQKTWPNGKDCAKKDASNRTCPPPRTKPRGL